ncbi:MAG: hypothetical protein JO200_02625 [Comamonas sp.]|nr:hypothetical protein [Comamonas sp.]
MIPAMPGAAAVGLLLLWLAALVAAGLLLWWGWRLWQARRGQPRPPLRIWQWLLAVLLSILPISTLLGLAQMAWNDHRQEQQLTEQERLTHLTLAQPVVWGDITLPAGSHIQRDMPEGGAERADGLPDLRGLQEVRFPHPVPLGEIWVNALSVYNQVLLELAEPYGFTAPSQQTIRCAAGNMVQLAASEQPRSFDATVFPKRLNGLVLADWVFDACFITSPISVRHWQDGRLIWAAEPIYESAESERSGAQ